MGSQSHLQPPAYIMRENRILTRHQDTSQVHARQGCPQIENNCFYPIASYVFGSTKRYNAGRIGGQVHCKEEEEEDEIEDEDEDDEDSGEEENEDNEIVDKEVNIEFEPYSISEFTDLLIQQNHIGSMIKQMNVSEDSDDDVDEDKIFGFISLLNLNERKGTQCAEQIKELILSCCEKNCKKSMVEQLDKLLNDNTKPVDFLLSERFINVPLQIALPMHQQFQKELTEAHKTNKACEKC
ncbi:BRCA2 and CDKN1A-interacting protein [Heterocephalus glaber]|uniref:BRCA2 and CDKN1A-interacting protein n=1 Tax=Heterocephalus glaber TaxID=10181 RepID=G5APA8_HETGA|nr:BRCA2 and CDKN1A-interacting protein [Heterocephalus glaber]